MDNVKETINQDYELAPKTSYWKNIVQRFCKNRMSVIGLVILIIILTMCIAAPLFTSYDPVKDMQLSQKYIPIGTEGHILGTDEFGRDVFSRLLYGGRISLLTSLTVALGSGAIGVVIGCIAGYFGGKVDALLMRFVEIFISFPQLILAILLMSILGSSQQNIVLTLAITGWTGFARLTRSQVLGIREQEYIESAKIAGFSHSRILFKHILPNCVGIIIVQLTLAAGGAILGAASLNFLGLGGDVSIAEWGAMLSSGKKYMSVAPHLTTIPGVVITTVVLALNWIGDGLRDAFDPKQKV